MATLRSLRPVWLIVLCCLLGCGKGDQPELGTVTGTVTMDGKPLPKVWVMFSPDKGRTSIAQTDENGEYELMYLEGIEGANIGSHKVSITTYNQDELEEMKFNTGKPVKEPIPAQYNVKSNLTKDVKAGPQVIDFDLKSTP